MRRVLAPVAHQEEQLDVEMLILEAGRESTLPTASTATLRIETAQASRVPDRA